MIQNALTHSTRFPSASAFAAVRSFFSRAHAFGASTVILLAAIYGAPVCADSAANSNLDGVSRSLKSADLKTKYAALETMKSNHTLAAAELLARTAVQEKDANFRLTALDQVATMGYSQVVPTLKPMLKDKAIAVRQRAARVIGMLGGPAAEKVLADNLAIETDADVKAALLQGLSYCGSAESVPAIQAAMSDTHPQVRANGVSALDRIPGEASKTALANAENDGDKNVRKLAHDAHQKRSKTK